MADGPKSMFIDYLKLLLSVCRRSIASEMEQLFILYLVTVTEPSFSLLFLITVTFLFLLLALLGASDWV